jgi:hypothetical protein
MIWQNTPPLPGSTEKFFGFNQFAMELNELPSENDVQRKTMLPTDSR